MSYSLNNMAAKIVEEEIIPNAEALNVDVFRLKNGATVIDMGVKAKGGWKAAKLFTDTCMGGMGELVYQSMYVGNHIIPTVSIQEIGQRAIGRQQAAGKEFRQGDPTDLLPLAGSKFRPVRQQGTHEMQTDRLFRISVRDAADLIQNIHIVHGQFFGQFPTQSRGRRFPRLDLAAGEFPTLVFPAGDQYLTAAPDHRCCYLNNSHQQ